MVRAQNVRLNQIPNWRKNHQKLTQKTNQLQSSDSALRRKLEKILESASLPNSAKFIQKIAFIGDREININIDIALNMSRKLLNYIILSYYSTLERITTTPQ